MQRTYSPANKTLQYIDPWIPLDLCNWISWQSDPCVRNQLVDRAMDPNV